MSGGTGPTMQSINTYQAQANVRPWVMPVAAAGIVISTIVSVALCFVLGDGAGGEGFPTALFVLVMLTVAVADIIVTRFFVLPQMATKAAAMDKATPQQIADSMGVIALGFSNATAIYGIVVAVFTANLLYVAPFPVLAAVTLVVLMSYVSEATGTLATARSIEGVR
jgi:hypothetical protein